MHIYVSGGSGRNGRLVVEAALARNHTVTALVRNPDSLTQHPLLTVVKGTPSSKTDVQMALTTPKHPSAIITTLNSRRTTDSPFSPLAPGSPPDLLSSSARILIAAIAASNFPQLPKIIFNSSQGVGSSNTSLILPIRLLMRHSTMSVSQEDHAEVDAIVKESGLKFVMARPCRLVEGPSAKVTVWPDSGKGAPWNPTITRESVGNWLVDAAETDVWDGRMPVISN